MEIFVQLFKRKILRAKKFRKMANYRLLKNTMNYHMFRSKNKHLKFLQTIKKGNTNVEQISE